MNILLIVALKVEEHRCQRTAGNVVYLQVHEAVSQAECQQSTNTPAQVPTCNLQVNEAGLLREYHICAYSSGNVVNVIRFVPFTLYNICLSHLMQVNIKSRTHVK